MRPLVTTLLMALVVSACSAGPLRSLPPTQQSSEFATAPPSQEADSAAATQHLSVAALEFDYPAGWSVNDQLPASTGFGQTLAIIGTLPWGPCAPSDINCHYQQRLEAGQITVEVGTLVVADGDICQLGRTRSDLAGRGPSDPTATGSLTRVDGRPTVRTDYVVDQADYYHSDEWRTWLIAAPGSTRDGYTIHGMYRGPGVEMMRSQLDQLIASVRLGPSTAGDPTQPTDCGAPFPS
jgi:hypothetical protein